jgi:hypothetical protein
MHQMWRLSDAVPQNLGLACTDDGLLLGRTSLIERRNGHFVVRARGEIERLLKCAYDGEPPVDRLMSGLARVASALNANDQCLARIAAVHLQMPDLASAAVRDALAAEDALIKYARDGGASAANWNPALHPRTGAPPNPGWFATTGPADGSSRVRFAENQDNSYRTDAARLPDDWVHLPEGHYIDELADFVEWIANAKPEDEEILRAEINRYYYAVGDINGGMALHAALSRAVNPDITFDDREELAYWVSHYAHTDPAVVAERLNELYGSILLLFPGMPGRRGPKPEPTPPVSGAARSAAEQAAADKAAWDNMNWDERGRYMEDRAGRTLHRNFPVIDKIPDGLATSIKSMDLRAATYQNPTPFAYRVRTYVSEVSKFVSGRLGEDVVAPSDVQGRALELVVPTGSMTPKQREIIEAIRIWAKTLRNPVEILINEK